MADNEEDNQAAQAHPNRYPSDYFGYLLINIKVSTTINKVSVKIVSTLQVFESENCVNLQSFLQLKLDQNTVKIVSSSTTSFLQLYQEQTRLHHAKFFCKLFCLISTKALEIH